jgi:hypothetical protein
MQLLLWVGVPVVLGVGQHVTYRLAVRRWQIKKLIERAERSLKEDSREEANADWHKVRVQSAGDRVSIGSSVEKPADMSATPTLTTTAFVAVDEGGHKFSIRADEQLKVVSLPGARRNLLEAVTTDSGVEQRYTFELGPEQTFYILGAAHTHTGAGPFREGAPVELAPTGGRYLVGEEASDGTTGSSGTPGCGKSASRFILGMNIVAAVAWPIPYMGKAYWAIALLAGLGALFIHSMEIWDEGKLEGHPEEIVERVKADLEANRLPQPYVESTDDEL